VVCPAPITNHQSSIINHQSSITPRVRLFGFSPDEFFIKGPVKFLFIVENEHPPA
jgi:hypothetical protein